MKLGDGVAKITRALNIEPCDECKERQKKLNDLGGKLANLFGWKTDPDESDAKPGEVDP